MGLLSDPNKSLSAKKSKFAIMLCKYHNLLCFVLYLAGIVWFCLLSHKNFNSGTYFSENALLPGKPN